MNPNAISLALKGVKSAYKSYSEYRDKKSAELYDAMQEAKKIAADQNEAAKEKAAELTSEVRERAAGLSDALADKAETASKDTKKSLKKVQRRNKKAAKKARKTKKDIAVRTQKAFDKVTGKEEQRAKNGRIATASLVFAVVAAIVGVIVWKLRKDDQLPVDPTPLQHKAEEVKDTVEETVKEKTAKILDDTAEEEEKLEELELEEADDEGMTNQAEEKAADK